MVKVEENLAISATMTPPPPWSKPLSDQPPPPAMPTPFSSSSPRLSGSPPTSSTPSLERPVKPMLCLADDIDSIFLPGFRTGDHRRQGRKLRRNMSSPVITDGDPRNTIRWPMNTDVIILNEFILLLPLILILLNKVLLHKFSFTISSIGPWESILVISSRIIIIYSQFIII